MLSLDIFNPDTCIIEKNNFIGSIEFMCDNIPNETTLDCNEVMCTCCDCPVAVEYMSAAQINGK
jgi:hypothetical protein